MLLEVMSEPNSDKSKWMTVATSNIILINVCLKRSLLLYYACEPRSMLDNGVIHPLFRATRQRLTESLSSRTQLLENCRVTATVCHYSRPISVIRC
jgi:hypothetical protein